LSVIVKSLDSRSKVIIVLCLSTLAVFVQDSLILACVLAASIIISLITGGKLLAVIKSLRRVWYLFFIMVLVQSIFLHSGRILLNIGQFQLLTTGGLIKGIEFILRIAIIIVSATILTTSNYREIIQGLVQWKVPYEIAFMVSIAIRFLPMLASEMRDTVIAIQLRGVEINKIPFKKKVKMYYHIFTPIVVSAIKKAQKLSIAMETRAFRAYPSRTSYLILKMSILDYLVISISISVTIFVMLIYYI